MSERRENILKNLAAMGNPIALDELRRRSVGAMTVWCVLSHHEQVDIVPETRVAGIFSDEAKAEAFVAAQPISYVDEVLGGIARSIEWDIEEREVQ